MLFLTLFFLILILSVFSSKVLGWSGFGQQLLLSSFAIALIVTIFGSLSIREEEEEQT
jgi:hypothetical protein